MDPRRQSHHGGDKIVQIQAQHPKRRREDSQQAGACIVIGKYLRLDIENDIVPAVTNSVRKVVAEELERKLVSRPTIDEAGTSGAKCFKLVFENALPDTIYTGSNIKATDDKLVEIALYDVRSQSIVSDGPLSSIKVKICVLNSEFGSEEYWSTKEFRANISRERENKGKLLKGDKFITLNKGVGHITNIEFTDNSKRTRTRRFKLGAIVQSTSNEADIREAISSSFMVKDIRVNKKHYPPSPSDEVWRLKNVSKDGKVHKRLSDELGIHTVEDLLQFYETDPSSLQQKSRINSTKLRETIKHAKTCYPAATSQGQNYHSHNTLNFDGKRLAEIPQNGYRNGEDFNPVDETLAQNFPSPLASPQITGQCGEALELPAAQRALTSDADQLGKRQDFSQPSTSTSDIGGAPYNYNQVDFEELLSGMCMEGNYLYLLGSDVPAEVPGVNSTDNDFSEFNF